MLSFNGNRSFVAACSHFIYFCDSVRIHVRLHFAVPTLQKVRRQFVFRFELQCNDNVRVFQLFRSENRKQRNKLKQSFPFPFHLFNRFAFHLRLLCRNVRFGLEKNFHQNPSN